MNFSFSDFVGYAVPVFAAIGGLSALLAVVSKLFPVWYESKARPVLKRFSKGLSTLDVITDALRKSNTDNKVFRTLDEVVDYLIRELEEAGIQVSETDLLQAVNVNPDGIRVERRDKGWKVHVRRSF